MIWALGEESPWSATQIESNILFYRGYSIFGSPSKAFVLSSADNVGENMKRDKGLDTLLDLDGSIFVQEDKSWIKIEAKRLKAPSTERPHGIKYSLTLHSPDGARILGFDNAHAVKVKSRKKYFGQIITYDHQHHSSDESITPYSFSSPEQLLEDFFHEIDEYLKKK